MSLLNVAMLPTRRLDTDSRVSYSSWFLRCVTQLLNSQCMYLLAWHALTSLPTFDIRSQLEQASNRKMPENKLQGSLQVPLRELGHRFSRSHNSHESLPGRGLRKQPTKRAVFELPSNKENSSNLVVVESPVTQDLREFVRHNIIELEQIKKSYHNISDERKKYMDIIDWLKYALADVRAKQEDDNQSNELKSIYSTAINEMVKEMRIESVEKSKLLKLSWEAVMSISSLETKDSEHRISLVREDADNKYKEEREGYDKEIKGYRDIIMTNSADLAKKQRFFYDVVTDNRVLRNRCKKLTNRLHHQLLSNSYLKEENMMFYRDNEKMKMVLDSEDLEHKYKLLYERFEALDKDFARQKKKITRCNIIKELDEEEMRNKLGIKEEVDEIVRRVDVDDLLDLEIVEAPKMEDLARLYYSAGIQTESQGQDRATNTMHPLYGKKAVATQCIVSERTKHFSYFKCQDFCKSVDGDKNDYFLLDAYRSKNRELQGDIQYRDQLTAKAANELKSRNSISQGKVYRKRLSVFKEIKPNSVHRKVSPFGEDGTKSQVPFDASDVSESLGRQSFLKEKEHKNEDDNPSETSSRQPSLRKNQPKKTKKTNLNQKSESSVGEINSSFNKKEARQSIQMGKMPNTKNYRTSKESRHSETLYIMVNQPQFHPAEMMKSTKTVDISSDNSEECQDFKAKEPKRKSQPQNLSSAGEDAAGHQRSMNVTPSEPDHDKNFNQTYNVTGVSGNLKRKSRVDLASSKQAELVSGSNKDKIEKGNKVLNGKEKVVAKKEKIERSEEREKGEKNGGSSNPKKEEAICQKDDRRKSDFHGKLEGQQELIPSTTTTNRPKNSPRTSDLRQNQQKHKSGKTTKRRPSGLQDPKKLPNSNEKVPKSKTPTGVESLLPKLQNQGSLPTISNRFSETQGAQKPLQKSILRIEERESQNEIESVRNFSRQQGCPLDGHRVSLTLDNKFSRFLPPNILNQKQTISEDSEQDHKDCSSGSSEDLGYKFEVTETYICRTLKRIDRQILKHKENLLKQEISFEEFLDSNVNCSYGINLMSSDIKDKLKETLLDYRGDSSSKGAFQALLEGRSSHDCIHFKRYLFLIYILCMEFWSLYQGVQNFMDLLVDFIRDILSKFCALDIVNGFIKNTIISDTVSNGPELFLSLKELLEIQSSHPEFLSIIGKLQCILSSRDSLSLREVSELYGTVEDSKYARLFRLRELSMYSSRKDHSIPHFKLVLILRRNNWEDDLDFGTSLNKKYSQRFPIHDEIKIQDQLSRLSVLMPNNKYLEAFISLKPSERLKDMEVYRLIKLQYSNEVIDSATREVIGNQLSILSDLLLCEYSKDVSSKLSSHK